MIGNDWDNVLKNIYDGEYFRPLLLKVQNEYKNKVIFPKKGATKTYETPAMYFNININDK